MLQKKDTWLVSRALLVALATTPLAAPLLVSESLLAQTPTATPTFTLPQNIPSGTSVRIDGSTSMAAINDSLKQKFETQFSGTQVELATNGSDAALQSLVDGKIDLAAIGRPLTAEEKAKGLTAFTVRREKIAIVVGEENPFKGSLSSEQFAKIFRGEITDWSQVGGPPGKIRVIDRTQTSDTRQAFRNYPVFKKAPFQAGATASDIGSDNTADMIKQLGKDGIGFAIANQVAQVPGVRILQMHKTLPEDPRYPFSQPLVYVYKKTPSTVAAGFLGFVGEPVAQAAIDQARQADAEKVAAAAGNTATDTAAAPNTTATPGTDAAATATATPNTTATPGTDAAATGTATPGTDTAATGTATPGTDAAATGTATPGTDAAATGTATPGTTTAGTTPAATATGATSGADVAAVPPGVDNAANAVSSAAEGGLSPWWFLLLLPLLGLLGWWWSRRRADAEYTENLPPPAPTGNLSAPTDSESPAQTLQDRPPSTPSTPVANLAADARETASNITNNVMNAGNAALAGGAALAAGAGAAAMGAFDRHGNDEPPAPPAIADPWAEPTTEPAQTVNTEQFNGINDTSEASVNWVENGTPTTNNLAAEEPDNSPSLVERITDTAGNLVDNVNNAGGAALASGAALAAGAGAAAMGAFDRLRPDDTPAAETPVSLSGETAEIPTAEISEQLTYPTPEASDTAPTTEAEVTGTAGNWLGNITDAGGAALASGAALAAGAGAAAMGAFDRLRPDDTPSAETPASLSGETAEIPTAEISEQLTYPTPEASDTAPTTEAEVTGTAGNWLGNITDAGGAALASGAALAAGAGAAAMGAFDRLRPDDTPSGETPASLSGETAEIPTAEVTEEVAIPSTEVSDTAPTTEAEVTGTAGNWFGNITDAGNAALASGAALAAGAGAAAMGAFDRLRPDGTPSGETPVEVSGETAEIPTAEISTTEAEVNETAPTAEISTTEAEVTGTAGNWFGNITDAGNATLASGAALAAGAGAAAMGAFNSLHSDDTPSAEPATAETVETPEMPVVEITPQVPTESSNLVESITGTATNLADNASNAGGNALAGAAALAAGVGAAAMGAFNRLRPDNTPSEEPATAETPEMPVVEITPQVPAAAESGNGITNLVESASNGAANLVDNTRLAAGAAFAGAAALATGVGVAAMSAVPAMASEPQPDATSTVPVADTPTVPIVVPHDYESRIHLISCNPQGAYTHWEITDAHKQALRSQGGSQLALRLMDVTDIDPSYQAARIIQQFDIEETARDRYLPIPVKGRNYVVEIGYLTNDGNWMPLARSATTRIPSYTARNVPLDVNAELILHGATEPGASLTIGGRTVKLSEDGTFRVRIPFPNGSLEYPIMTVSADGEQASILHLHFTRETGEQGE
jgi:phosphate transport system substrate-binding protein